MIDSDLQYLSVSLPEDIEKLKWFGDFERAKKLIDMCLQKDIPEALKKRLGLERWILERMPLEYIYTEEEALEQLQKTLKGTTKEELEEFRDEGAAEWIFIKGQVRYKDDFVENLLKTRTELWPRLKDPSRVEGRIQGNQLLDQVVLDMKKKGGLAYQMRIRASLKVEPQAEKPGKLIKVHLPVPVEYGQVKNFRLLAASIPQAKIAPADYPQRTVYMETNLESGQEFWVEYEFENHTRYVDTKEALRADLDGKKNSCCLLSDSELALYLEEQMPHIAFTPYLKALAEEIVGKEQEPLKKARRIYDYITTHIMYSFVRQYSTIANLPEYMATGMKGDCGIYALLFIVLCRIVGVPARWQSGLYATPLDIGCHDWAQFYVEPYGWLYADCSFGGAAYRAGAVERWDFYFGNVDPFRVPCCSEFQYEWIPASPFLREDPYDNQVGEAEYEDRRLVSHLEYKTSQKILDLKEISFEK